MILHWDRAGHPMIDVLEWARLYESHGYRFVAVDREGGKMISTIWEGLDASHGTAERPLIFTTAYFVQGHLLDKFSWPSEEAALTGHAIMCRELLGRPPRPEDGHLDRALEDGR